MSNAKTAARSVHGLYFRWLDFVMGTTYLASIMQLVKCMSLWQFEQHIVIVKIPLFIVWRFVHLGYIADSITLARFMVIVTTPHAFYPCPLLLLPSILLQGLFLKICFFICLLKLLNTLSQLRHHLLCSQLSARLFLLWNY